MRSESEVRKLMEEMKNQEENGKLLYTKTGKETFKDVALQGHMAKNVLLWVLGEKDLDERTVVMEL